LQGEHEFEVNILNITIPKLNKTMENGTITKWFASAGDYVNEGDLLFGVGNEKGTLDVEAPASGVIKEILYKEGSLVPVKTAIAILEECEVDTNASNKKTESEKKKK
jgi:Pyruvate/2-oxoglutarate dehydrogenase complex, dihydrolipoamide acyltransferase (E2) component, and related enzymes